MRPQRRARDRRRARSGSARRRPLVRAARLVAAGRRDPRAQPAARAGGRRRARPGVGGRVTYPTRSVIPRSSRSSSPASASTRSSTGGATAPSSTRSDRCTGGRRPTARSVRAWQLPEGYFSAGGLDADGDLAATVARLRPVIDRIVAAGGDPVLLMNGFDHLPADESTGHVAALIGAQRVLLDDAVAAAPGRVDAHRMVGRARRRAHLEPAAGRLVGAHAAEAAQPGGGDAAHRMGRTVVGVRARARPRRRTARARSGLADAALQPGARLDLRLLDRSGARAHGRPLRRRRRARPRHRRNACSNGSPGGTSRATRRSRRRRPRLSSTRRPPPRTDVVRVPLEGFPPWWASMTRFDMHPLSMPSFRGVTVDGRPARLVAERRLHPRAVPARARRSRRRVRRGRRPRASGARRYTVEPAGAAPDEVDDGRAIDAGDVRVVAADDGTLSVHARRQRPSPGCSASRTRSTGATPTTAIPIPCARCWCSPSPCERTRHKSGIARLRVVRELDDIGTLTVEACVAPGVPFVRCDRAPRQPGARPSAATALPDGRSGRHVRRGHHVRHRAPIDRAGRRRRRGSIPRPARSPSRAGSRPTASSSARPGYPRPRSRRKARCSSRSCAASARWRGSSCARGRCPPVRR